MYLLTQYIWTSNVFDTSPTETSDARRFFFHFSSQVYINYMIMH